MTDLALIRVDARLIHGQVASKWSNCLNVNRIIVVDDETANDDFMKKFFEMAAMPGIKVTIFSVSQAAEEWQKNKFGDGKAIVIIKNIASAKKAYEEGFRFPSLDIGQVPGGGDRFTVYDSINLNNEEVNLLEKLQELGVRVYFQTLPEPDGRPVELETILERIKR
jgi:mannose/fructose/N-acetylgalactosamine-specific phosphotransferase system component IIB